MSFVREVIDWGIAHNAYFHCHDLSKQFGCSINKASQTIHQIRQQPKVEYVEKLVPNPNPKPQGVDHIIAIHVLELKAPLGKPRFEVEGVPEDLSSKHIQKLHFASLNDANSAGYVRSCVTNAARRGTPYCGYYWYLTEAK